MSESAAYTEGARCRQCLRWFWDKDGRWHRGIPARMLGVAELAREVTCPRCAVARQARVEGVEVSAEHPAATMPPA